MAVYYDTTTGRFMISPEECGDCGAPLYDTGCDAPGCAARCCMDCGTGCDLELDDEGQCATASAAESDEDHEARVNAERAAFGLRPLSRENQ